MTYVTAYYSVYLVGLAVAIVTAALLTLTYGTIHYRGKFEATWGLYREATTQLKYAEKARNQAAQEFLNLKAIVDAWNNRPITATLTDLQVHQVVQQIGSLVVAPKDPKKMD